MRFIVLKENSLSGVREAVKLACNMIHLQFTDADIAFYVPDWFNALSVAEMNINPFLWNQYQDCRLYGCPVFPGYENDIVAVNIADPNKYSIRIKMK